MTSKDIGTPRDMFERPSDVPPSLLSSSSWVHNPLYRRFFCEARNGILTDLLLDVLENSQVESMRAELAEELIWSCWTIHDDDKVKIERVVLLVGVIYIGV